MSGASIHIGTTIICYSCRFTRSDIIWEHVVSAGQNIKLLDILFDSCPECITFAHVYNPRTALISKYLDPRRYLNLVKWIAFKFNYTPVIPWEKKFSITALKMKSLTKIKVPNKTCYSQEVVLYPPRFSDFSQNEMGPPLSITNGLPGFEIPGVPFPSLPYSSCILESDWDKLPPYKAKTSEKH